MNAVGTYPVVMLQELEMHHIIILGIFYAKQRHLVYKKGEANQKQQLSDYICN